jgi:hypothetical protein
MNGEEPSGEHSEGVSPRYAEGKQGDYGDVFAAAAGMESSSSSRRWPIWYTWPLLSRVAFTLGNLTTTNDSNRYSKKYDATWIEA